MIKFGDVQKRRNSDYVILTINLFQLYYFFVETK